MLQRKSGFRKKPWEKKEDRDAESFGGSRVKGSGSKWFNPGDVKTADFLIQTKQTAKNSFSITSDTWQKTVSEANHSNRMPALSVELGDGTEVVVVSTADFASWFKDKECEFC